MKRSPVHGAVLALMLAGCTAASISSGDRLSIEGSVSRKDFEGGFWAIDADDGRKFLPLNLPGAFQQDKLRVKVEATPKPDVMTIHMYGQTIEIVEIRKAE